MEATEDVLAAVAGSRRPGQLVVGFAAEHGAEAVDHAREKLERKVLDAIVVNDIAVEGIGFDSADNEVVDRDPRAHGRGAACRQGPDRRADRR